MKYTLYEFSQLLHESKQTGSSRNELLIEIQEREMLPFYREVLVTGLGLPEDSAMVQRLSQSNASTLERLQERLKDAKENLGETETSQALLAIADHFAGIGDKNAAIKAYETAYSSTAPLGHRIDIVFSLIRLALLFKDSALIISSISRAKGFFYPINPQVVSLFANQSIGFTTN